MSRLISGLLPLNCGNGQFFFHFSLLPSNSHRMTKVKNQTKHEKKTNQKERLLQMTSMLDNEPQMFELLKSEMNCTPFHLKLEVIGVSAIASYCRQLIVAKKPFLYFNLGKSCAIVYCRSHIRECNFIIIIYMIGPCPTCSMSAQSLYWAKTLNKIKYNSILICFSIHFLYFLHIFSKIQNSLIFLVT